MLDADPIQVNNKPDSFTGIITDGLAGIQWKLLLFVFLIFLFVSSDVFTNRVLTKFKGAVDSKYPTSYGVIIQDLFLIFFFILFDMGISQKVI